MNSTPRKPGVNPNNISTKVPSLKGLFQDGIWHCNCNPRLPASHFQVRKEGPNKGRWFYTCQESKNSGCGFFLWDADASGREMKAVINNSRSEPDTPGAERAARDGLDKTTVVGHIEASNKWMSELRKNEEEEFGDWPLSVKDEQRLVTAVETDALPGAYPETPRKAVKFNATTTPGSFANKSAQGLPTPITTSKDDVFTTPSSNRPRGTMIDGDERGGLISPLVSPTSIRVRDASGVDSNFESSDYDITNEVMDLLKDYSLKGQTTTELRKLLNRHALRTQGIAKGRDITRIALKSKDSKIAELQQRITALESEREMDKVVIRHIKSDMAQSVASRQDRGRGGIWRRGGGRGGS